jgi:predicted metal-dependent phosphoesterase TrpH
MPSPTDPTVYADLHAHTTASDGTLTPAELVRVAQNAGLAYLAVTDHDTTAGVGPAREAARGTGLTVVPGVELSAKGAPGECHLLGFGIAPDHDGLNGRLRYLSDERRTRNARMAERLTALGMPLTPDEVTGVAPAGANVGRPHFAQAMVAKGYVATLAEAFDRWLGDGKPAQLPKEVLPPAEAIALVHAAGGLCFLAHPGLLKMQAHETHETRFRALKEMGLDGIEAYYPKHSPAETERFLRLAEKFGFLVTGGSDFHGANKPDVPLGIVTDGRMLPASLLPPVLLGGA